jgi:uncharacterized protein
MEIKSSVAVRKSLIQGNGVFATKPIKSNETIHVMNGKEISLFECIWMVLLGKLHVDNPLQIDKYSYIILDELSVATNHSCNPNCTIVGKNELVARRDIAIGEEITFDYSLTVMPNFYTKNWQMTCCCGTDNCRKQIGNLDSIGKAQLIDYFEKNQMQDCTRTFLLKHRAKLLATSSKS